MNELQVTEKSSTDIAARPSLGFAELMQAARAFAKSSIVPTAFRNKPDDAFVALEWGMELGMKPMASLQNIYVVNGRPTLSAQSMAGLIKARPDYRGIVFDSSPTKAKVTIKRALLDGTIETHTGEFTIEQARVAGLTGKDNWKSYPQQMLEARALAFAVRKAFPDVFSGIYTKEEAQDFTEADFKAAEKIGEPVIVSAPDPAEPKPAASAPEKPAQPAIDYKADILKTFDAIGKILTATNESLAPYFTEDEMNDARSELKRIRYNAEGAIEAMRIKDHYEHVLEERKQLDGVPFGDEESGELFDQGA